MKKIFYLLFLFISISLGGNIDMNNSNIARVGNYTITNAVFGKNIKKVNSLDKDSRNKLIDHIIDDEILVQYILKNDPILKNKNPKERIIKAINKVREMAIKDINSSITEKDIKEYYNKNKDKLGIDDYSVASHILVNKKEEAENIINQLKKAKDLNATFVKLAKEKSVDYKTSKQGGNLGLFPDRIMVSPFKKTLKELKENEFTKKPIKTRFGYHIIWLHKKFNKEYFSYERIKNSLRKRVIAEKLNAWIKDKLDKAKKDIKVVRLDK